jgi:hypoxanthine phosphoribosyltransferase
MPVIQLKDKRFTPFIFHDDIQEKIGLLGKKINEDYAGKRPLFISVLNGSFMFASDLLKNLDMDCDISFVKVASYVGVHSSGNVMELIGLTENVEGRDVVIIEDIVDTGTTLEKVTTLINDRHPASLRIATLLFKPDAYKKSIEIDYAAIEIPNNFIVGFGLDYDGLGRNLKDIYTLVES